MKHPADTADTHYLLPQSIYVSSQATTFDALLKLGSTGSPASFESWEDIKAAFGWSEAALKRRKRETEIAIHLRKRTADYVEGYLALDAFKDTCWEEAVGIAKGGGVRSVVPACNWTHGEYLCYNAYVLISAFMQ